VKLTSPMTASRLAVGTPPVQLAALLQAVLVVPFQLVWADAPAGNASDPATNSKRNQLFSLRRGIHCSDWRENASQVANDMPTVLVVNHLLDKNLRHQPSPG